MITKDIDSAELLRKIKQLEQAQRRHSETLNALAKTVGVPTKDEECVVTVIRK